MQDWTVVTGDIAKFGLGLLSMTYCIILAAQHYWFLGRERAQSRAKAAARRNGAAADAAAPFAGRALRQLAGGPAQPGSCGIACAFVHWHWLRTCASTNSLHLIRPSSVCVSLRYVFSLVRFSLLLEVPSALCLIVDLSVRRQD